MPPKPTASPSAGAPTLSEGLTARLDAAPSALWSAGWSVLTLSALGLLLALFGDLGLSWTAALGIAALPGLVGLAWRPRGEALPGLLALWCLCAAAAAALTGGLSGPLALICLGPLVAAVALGALLMDGVVFAALALGLGGLAAILWRLPAPGGAQGLGFSAAGACILLIAAATAVLIRHRRLAASESEGAAEIVRLQTLLGDIPGLALLMDASGGTAGVFGQPLSMLDHDDLRQGLAPAIIAQDQARLGAALALTKAGGAAEAILHPVSRPDRQLIASLRLTGDSGVMVLLRELSPGESAASLGERVAELESARISAETDRARTEEALRARSRFLANMSHELRTPLNAIMGFSDIMRVRMFGELSPKYGEYAELIHESGRHLMDLISDVLDMSKIDADKFTLSLERFDVREAMGAALRLTRVQADEAGVKLRGVLPPEPLEVEADKRAIKQIVLNLVSNALKFTPRGGAVTVTGQIIADSFEIVVTDTGIGIDQADLERLGRPFEQAGAAQDRARGTGLGLSLVKAFAQLHGGDMNIESQLGEGTSVTVRLPVLVAALPASTPEGEADPAAPPAHTAQVIQMPPRGE